MENELLDRVARAIAEALAPAYAEREEPTDEDHRLAAQAAIFAYNEYLETRT
jgi:hypothetical protein